MRIIALLVVALVAGCGAKQKMASAPMAAMAQPAAPAAAPPPLDRSVFARDPGGQLAEDALQKILASPIELDLPSRVGVLPIITATDWRGPSPDFERVPAGVSPLVGRLRKDAAFSLVTEMMPIPSGALGMEALREAAARYRLRYIVLYREVLAKKEFMNAWAWTYATIVGALFAPGQQHEVYGYIEATMFDVKTGLLMFTTRRAIMASKRSNNWRNADKLAILAATATSKFAPQLATDFLVDVRRFANAAIAENAKILGNHPVTGELAAPPKLAAPPTQDSLVQVPPPGGPTVATE